ncbi:hypothetical protein DFH09DRAFT_1289480 [Mycena vulgaris]|nr:hypothetical protein DFH09DRAFT_1289480 [Mycena vulgaris]
MDSPHRLHLFLRHTHECPPPQRPASAHSPASLDTALPRCAASCAGGQLGCASGLRSSSVGERGRKEEGGEGEAGRPLRLCESVTCVTCSMWDGNESRTKPELPDGSALVSLACCPFLLPCLHLVPGRHQLIGDQALVRTSPWLLLIPKYVATKSPTPGTPELLAAVYL